MTYKANIPQPTDNLKVSQYDIVGNFQEINTLFNINHGNLGSPNSGKHRYVQMPERAVPPVTDILDTSVYTAQGNKSAVTELFFRRENSGDIINLTQGFANINSFGNGYAYIGSSLIKWGYADCAVPNALAGTYTMNFPISANIPGFATSPSIFNTAINSIGSNVLYVLNGTQTNLSFDIIKTETSNNMPVNFIAIGT